jgi:hypothetical protein
MTSRRIDVLRMVPAELAINEAIRAVEAMPADERLTRAVVLLTQAKDKVADYVDGVPNTYPAPNPDSPAHAREDQP